MEIKFNLDIDRSAFQSQIHAEAQRAMSRQLESYFRKESKINGRIYQQEGIGNSFIREEFDKLLMEYQASGKLQKMIEVQFEISLQEAIKKATDHQAGKLAFSKTN